MPSMRGISTSRVMTSGISCWIRRAATKGSDAVPITSMPGSALRISVKVCRTDAESSMINTRTGRLTRDTCLLKLLPPEYRCGDRLERQCISGQGLGVTEKQETTRT